MNFLALSTAAAAAALLATSAAGAVVDVQPHGFKLSHTAEVAAPPAAVWQALVAPARWWSSSHSWSGDAKNLSLEPTAGGCFCERWAGGSAAHLTVTQAAPNQKLHLWGALGPLQMQGVAGGMTVTLKPTDGGTTVTLTYAVGGYLDGGAAKWAPLVDGVLGTQLGRLERLIETGKPD